MDKVLIVDDNPKFLSSLCDGLKKYESQFEVSPFSNAEEATQALKEDPVSVLVTDLGLLNNGGRDLITYMVQNHPHVPCIVMADPAQYQWEYKRFRHPPDGVDRYRPGRS